jgi:hypothetical protein
MPGFDGTGPNGMGPMTGGSRGYCNPRGTGAGLPYRFPRRMASNFYSRRGAYGFERFAPQPVRKDELGFLKNEAQSLNNELKALEARIQALETRS